jgi:stearoyl-CoA desaturase (Delta-9 desaturase)
MYIRALETLKLATVRKVAPRLKFNRAKLNADLETLQSVITHRYAVLTSYARSMKQAYAVEVAHLRDRARRGEVTQDVPSFSRLRQWFHTDAHALAETDRAHLASTLEQSRALRTIYAMRQELASLWERSNDSREQLLTRLQDWCHRAEESGIAPLQKFSRRLRSYA